MSRNRVVVPARRATKAGVIDSWAHWKFKNIVSEKDLWPCGEGWGGRYDQVQWTRSSSNNFSPNSFPFPFYPLKIAWSSFSPPSPSSPPPFPITNQNWLQFETKNPASEGWKWKEVDQRPKSVLKAWNPFYIHLVCERLKNSKFILEILMAQLFN